MEVLLWLPHCVALREEDMRGDGRGPPGANSPRGLSSLAPRLRWEDRHEVVTLAEVATRAGEAVHPV